MDQNRAYHSSCEHEVLHLLQDVLCALLPARRPFAATYAFALPGVLVLRVELARLTRFAQCRLLLSCACRSYTQHSLHQLVLAQ